MVWRKLDLLGRPIFLKSLELACARNGGNRYFACSQPCQCDLSRRAVDGVRYFYHDERANPNNTGSRHLRKNCGLVRRQSLASRSAERLNGAPESNPRPRGEYLPRSTMPSALMMGHDLRFHVSTPEGVFGLECANWVHLVRTFYGGGIGIGQADESNFSRLDQFGHGTHGVLDRRIGVDAVLIVQVNAIGSQPLQACLARCTYIFGAAVQA